LSWLGTEETKPNTTKASNTGLKRYQLTHTKEHKNGKPKQIHKNKT